MHSFQLLLAPWTAEGDGVCEGSGIVSRYEGHRETMEALWQVLHSRRTRATEETLATALQKDVEIHAANRQRHTAHPGALTPHTSMKYSIPL